MQSEAEEERRSARQKQTASRESDKQKRLQAADKEVADVCVHHSDAFLHPPTSRPKKAGLLSGPALRKL